MSELKAGDKVMRKCCIAARASRTNKAPDVGIVFRIEGGPRPGGEGGIVKVIWQKDNTVYSENSEDLLLMDEGKKQLPLPNRQEFSTGAVRDSQEGKPRYSLIPVEALRRLAMRYTEGAIQYGENNYQKGMPFSRVMDSLLRHAFAYASRKEGNERSEDHLAAIAWNAFTLMFYEERIGKGELPFEIDDLP